jgi:VCBS repeat-containing protein
MSHEGGTTMKMTTSDEALAGAVRSELEWDPKVDQTHIGVAASDGAVTLTGYVPTYAQEHAAVRAAERIHGVRAVADDLEVRLSQHFERNDTEIAEAISRQGRSNMLIPQSVSAEVKNGAVTLHGEVEWAFQRDDAAEAIRHLAGVRSVTNDITVKPSSNAESDEIREGVEDAIERQANIDSDSISVMTTQDGTVHLQGRVRSLAESRAAVQAAEAAPGVKVVENDLAIRPWGLDARA